MPEPAPARFVPPATDSIEIIFSAGGYSPVPVDSSVADNGAVHFICGQACWIWTIVNGALTNAFDGESNDYVPCGPGNNGPYTPAVQDTTITIVPLSVNSVPPLVGNPRETVRGTIKVGSGSSGKEHTE
jgi:hypothetical protein